MNNVLYEETSFRLKRSRDGDPYIEETPHESAVVLANEDDDIYVVKQFREPVDDDVYELPAGGCHSGEDPEAGARRELEEETGIVCGKLHFLGTIYSNPCMSNDVAHLYFTKDILEKHEQNLDDNEQLTVHRFKINDVLEHIKNGDWPSAELGHTLFLAKLKGYL